MAHILPVSHARSLCLSKLLGLTKLLLVQHSEEAETQVARQTGPWAQRATGGPAGQPILCASWSGDILQETGWYPLILHNWEPLGGLYCLCDDLVNVCLFTLPNLPDLRLKAP